MKRASCVLAFGFGLIATPVKGGAAGALEPLGFLVGEWEAGANAGPHGQGSGRYAFALDLQDRVMVRRNHAEYPASGTSPAVRHDDLMVIYAAQGAAVEAHYYDNEGHVIHYAVSVPRPNEVLFLGDVSPGAPRFKLTYKLRADGVLEGAFAVAPPGQPEAFKPYLAWESRRLK